MTLLTRKYRITTNSSLKLIGHTNVSDFTCYCRQNYPVGEFSLDAPTEDSHQTQFHATTLKIPISNLDCGNTLMNLNMRKTLHARQHPNIIIEFLKATWKKDIKPWLAESPVQVRALTRVSINGHQNEYWLNLSGQKDTSGYYQCKGKKTLQMTDFGITPPTAMMGMVKVKDRITIDMDLKIEVL